MRFRRRCERVEKVCLLMLKALFKVKSILSIIFRAGYRDGYKCKKY